MVADAQLSREKSERCYQPVLGHQIFTEQSMEILKSRG